MVLVEVKKVSKVYPLVIHSRHFILLQRATWSFASYPQGLRLVTTTTYIK